jgi:hypothetical protein
MAAGHKIRPALLSGSRSLSLLSPITCPTAPLALQRSPNPPRYYRSGHSRHTLVTVISAVLATSALVTTACETTGPADETEDSTNGDIIIQDGIDAGSESPTINASTEEVAIEEDDDPNNDEETTCSICLINRQGPCRKYWLKFERCMKDHSAEKDRRQKEIKAVGRMGGENKEPTLEKEWDGFMEKVSLKHLILLQFIEWSNSLTSFFCISERVSHLAKTMMKKKTRMTTQQITMKQTTTMQKIWALLSVNDATIL